MPNVSTIRVHAYRNTVLWRAQVQERVKHLGEVVALGAFGQWERWTPQRRAAMIRVLGRVLCSSGG